ncbi:30S ribosomal protein S7 [Nanoarchaeota archaeon]
MVQMKIFDMFDVSEVKVEDPGLRRYLNLSAKLVPKNRGRERVRFAKANINIIERTINLLSVPGHRGKKHKIMTKHATGKWGKNAKVLIGALKIVEEKTKQNPVQVFVKAIENASPRDEITTIEYGGAKYPQSVDVAPLRRIAISVRNLVHGAQDKAFNKKPTISQTLAIEIIGAANENNDSFAYSKKVETEKMADSAR